MFDGEYFEMLIEFGLLVNVDMKDNLMFVFEF